ncbi:hypothetical protein ACWF82_06150 [Nocardia sp. NPDC055053]
MTEVRLGDVIADPAGGTAWRRVREIAYDVAPTTGDIGDRL